MTRKTDTRVWDRIRRAVRLAESDAHVQVGVLASKGGDATTADGKLTMIELAAIHEFGSDAAGIPARSWLRGTFENRRDEVARTAAKIAAKVIEGMPLGRGLGLLGAWAVGEIKKHVRSRIDPPNSQATIDAKGSSVPLIDTGRMINSVAHDVIGADGDL